MFRSLKLRFLALVLVAWSPAVLAIDEVFATAEGAIRGYDAVAYHTRSEAVPGSAAITHEWNGATWRFSSEANRALFAADPERYAPRFGGFCAYGTAQGYKVSTQPEAFALVDGRLYLNYNADVQTTWNKDRPGHIAAADRNWSTLEHSRYTLESK